MLVPVTHGAAFGAAPFRAKNFCEKGDHHGGFQVSAFSAFIG